MNTLINDFLIYLQNERRYATTTITSYKSDLNIFSNYLISKNINSVELINQKIIRKYLSSMIQSESAITTVRMRISRINCFFLFLKKREKVLVNPVFGLRKPKPPKRVPIIINRHEVKRLVDNSREVGETYKSVRDNLIIQILFQTGIRRSELVNLKLTDIDWENRTIQVFAKRKQRLVPFGNALYSSMKHYLKVRGSHFKNDECDYLIVSMKGQKIATDTIYVIVREHLLSMNVGKQNPHFLRHIFATEMLKSGSDIYEIKELLGHSHITTTQVYTHMGLNSMLENYKKYFLFEKK